MNGTKMTEADYEDFCALVDALPQSHVYISHVDRECRFTRYYNIHPNVNVIGKIAHELYDCEGQRKLTEIRQRVMKTGIAENFELNLRGGPPLFSIQYAQDNKLPEKCVQPFRTYQACVVPRKVRGSGEIIGATTILTEITQRKQAEEERDQLTLVLKTQLKKSDEARERSEKAEKAINEFLANMSHELRTPLNTILGIVDLLNNSNPPLNPEQLELIRLVDNHGHELLRMINGILDFSKVEAGKVACNPVAFDFPHFLSRISNLLGPSISAKKNTLCISISPNVPKYIKTDPQHLRSILLNLLANACRFTENGRISINTTALESKHISESDGTPQKIDLRIEVKDTGIGIAEKDIPHLFQRFYQADSSSTRAYGGTGLGLAISKGLVEVLHGKIGVTSNKGQGSVFHIDIPVEKMDSMPDDIIENTASSAALNKSGVLTTSTLKQDTTRQEQHDLRALIEPHSKPTTSASSVIKSNNQRSQQRLILPDLKAKVLLADDNQINQKVITKMLERMKCHVDVAQNGQEAINMFQEKKVGYYDLVLLDLHMPVKDGIAASKEIREWERKQLEILCKSSAENNKDANPLKLKAVHIAAITADVISGTMQRCLEAGMNDFISKPVSLNELARVCQNGLGVMRAAVSELV